MPSLDVDKAVGEAGIAPQTLPQFLGEVVPLSSAERRTIVDQALLLMEEVYVHLPLKRAMHAVDPVQRLRLLRHRLDLVDDRAFHEEMISTFMGVRDLHTNYILPSPYNRTTAFLPFEVREFYHEGVPVYIVGGVLQGFQHPTFKPGVRVTHMNGVPIARAVELNARRHAGSNAAANHARGLERLTFRPLMMSLPPDEEWAEVRYNAADGSVQEIRFNWMAYTQPESIGTAGAKLALSSPKSQYLLAQGVDVQTEAVNGVKKRLFAKERVEIEAAVLKYLKNESTRSGEAEPDFSTVSKMPDIFQFETKKTAHGDRAYVRIESFSVPEPVAFVNEFIRILKLLPQTGLILDVRGNGGGNIIAGEMLLQTLSPRQIEPERLHFINTATMLKLVEGVPSWFGKWAPSMRHALLIGAAYSQGLPFLEPEEYNAIGRKYPGKVVLLTDAFCYSTTDIFSAGFQDHGIGPILGNDPCTGAGGANVFDWDLMNQLFDAFSNDHSFRQLPKGAGLRVAIRRTTRVRAKSGEPLEDLGVEPDHLHRPTLNDLIGNDRELFDKAGELTKA